MKKGTESRFECWRLKLVFWLCCRLIGPVVRLIYKYKCDSFAKIKGPYFLLLNHNVNLDPAFAGIAANRRLCFVASEHIMREGIGTWAVTHFFKPIIHVKGKAGVNTLASIIRTLKSGTCVCMFPEGNRSFNGLTGEIPDVTGKLARKSGVKLITLRVEGGYFTQPRWGFSVRKGQLYGHLMHVYEPDELKAMTDAEVTAAIQRDLYEDAYATQAEKRVPFKGKDLAKGLETAVYMCPRCRRFGTLHSKSDQLMCECGFSACFDEYGDLKCDDGTVTGVTAMDRLQHEELNRRLDESYSSGKHRELFADVVIANKVGEGHKVIETTESELKAFSDHIEFNGRSFQIGDFAGMAVHSRNTITVHISADGAQYEVFGADEMFNALKYLYLYNYLYEHRQCEEE